MINSLLAQENDEPIYLTHNTLLKTAHCGYFIHSGRLIVFTFAWQKIASVHNDRLLMHFSIMHVWDLSTEWSVPMHLIFTNILFRMLPQMQVVESITRTATYPRNLVIFVYDIINSQIKHTPSHHSIAPQQSTVQTLQISVINPKGNAYTILLMKCEAV